MFLHHASKGITILHVYVDDIIITGPNADMIHQLQASLHDSFHMNDLGPLNYFLGLEVHQSSKGIVLNQHKYTLDLIDMAGLQNSAPVDTPVEVNVKRQQEYGDPIPNPSLYRRLVGSLVYLTITRPDISYAVNLVNKFMTNPKHLHLAALRRIICYLLRTPTHGLFYSMNSPITLTAYSDANWAGCPATRRSTTGWCTNLGDSLICGNVRNRIRSRNLIPKMSIMLCPLLVQKSFGFAGYFQIFVFMQLMQHLSMQMILAPFLLRKIQYFTSAPNTLRLIAILYKMNTSVVSSPFRTSLLIYKMPIFSLKDSHDLGINSWLAN